MSAKYTRHLYLVLKHIFSRIFAKEFEHSVCLFVHILGSYVTFNWVGDPTECIYANITSNAKAYN